MKKTVSKIALVVCSGFATMLAGCPDGPTEDAGGGETACEANDDCGDGEVCNGTTDVCEEPCDPAAADACDDGDACYGDDVAGDNVCQAECDGDASCGADRTCNLTTGQCIHGCDSAEDLRLICAGETDKCDTTTGECVECLANADCTAPEICNLTSGICQAPDACDAPGTLGDAPCAATEMCMPDGSCLAECDDDACAANGELCQDDVGAAGFNTCVDSDLVRSDCTAAGAHSRDGDGPTLISVGNGITIADPAANCGGANQSVVEYEARFYSADALDTSGAGFYNDVCFMTNGTGCVNNQGNTYFATTYTATGNMYVLKFQLCQVGADAAEFAIYVRDTDTDVSNASCFDKKL